jgi:hypothetical protein
MNLASGKSTILQYLPVVGTLTFIGCTSVMSVTPQQMSDFVINHVTVDPKTDPNPQTAAFDQTACANKARLEYPIVHIDEGGIMAGSMLSGAAGGAASGAAGAAGTGHAEQAAAISSVGGALQGGQNSLNVITKTYLMQMYKQGINYGLCLEEHGHAISGMREPDLARARSEDLARAGSQ